MAVFTSSAFAMRRNLILEALRDAGAVSPETAKALEETGLVNPEMFAEYTQQLVDMGVIRRTDDGRYYVN